MLRETEKTASCFAYERILDQYIGLVFTMIQKQANVFISRQSTLIIAH